MNKGLQLDNNPSGLPQIPVKPGSTLAEAIMTAIQWCNDNRCVAATMTYDDAEYSVELGGVYQIVNGEKQLVNRNLYASPFVETEDTLDLVFLDILKALDLTVFEDVEEWVRELTKKAHQSSSKRKLQKDAYAILSQYWTEERMHRMIQKQRELGDGQMVLRISCFRERLRAMSNGCLCWVG
jgi:hypothetical protein